MHFLLGDACYNWSLFTSPISFIEILELWNRIESLPNDIFLSFSSFVDHACSVIDFHFYILFSKFHSTHVSTSMSLRCCNNFNMYHWLLCEFHIPFCSLSLPTHQSMSMHYPISQLLDFFVWMLLCFFTTCWVVLSLQVF